MLEFVHYPGVMEPVSCSGIDCFKCPMGFGIGKPGHCVVKAEKRGRVNNHHSISTPHRVDQVGYFWQGFPTAPLQIYG